MCLVIKPLIWNKKWELTVIINDVSSKKLKKKNKLMHVMVTKTNKLEAIENRSKCVNRFAKENYTVMQT